VTTRPRAKLVSPDHPTRLIELLIRVLCDPGPQIKADGAYLFAQTIDNQQSVFETGLTLIKQGQTEKLLIPGSVPRCGYPGSQAWQQALIAQGLPETKIVGVPTGEFPTLHTLIEATALLQYVQTAAISTLFVVAPPFQQLRAFITTVTVALRSRPDLRIYNRPGLALPWHETVAHSQGALYGRRSELIQSELERIEKYRGQGNLVSEAAVLAYLEQRDQ